MIDALTEKGWGINRVDNGDPAQDPHYYNRGSEIWFTAAQEIRRNLMVLEGIDKATFEQLTTRRIAYKVKRGDSKALLYAESKDDMKARGLESPDRGDAIMGAISCSSYFDPGVVTPARAKGIVAPRSEFAITTEHF
jgi:hypothetical protein